MIIDSCPHVVTHMLVIICSLSYTRYHILVVICLLLEKKPIQCVAFKILDDDASMKICSFCAVS